jgi:hypothetical protein
MGLTSFLTPVVTMPLASVVNAVPIEGLDLRGVGGGEIELVGGVHPCVQTSRRYQQ